MRAYLRLDPLIDERKQHYTPAQLGTYVKVLVMAMRQTDRGRFRSVDALKRALPMAYARHIDFLVGEHDISVLPDGRAYVEGWDEWQEGDITVAERMARLRNRHRNATVTEAYLTAIGVDVDDSVGVDDSLRSLDDARDDITAFGQATGRMPSVKQRKVLDDILQSHDVTGPKWAGDIIRANPTDPIGAVIAAQKAWRQKRKSEAITVEDEAKAEKRKPGLRDPLLQEIAQSMAAKYADPAVPA